MRINNFKNFRILSFSFLFCPAELELWYICIYVCTYINAVRAMDLNKCFCWHLCLLFIRHCGDLLLSCFQLCPKHCHNNFLTEGLRTLPFCFAYSLFAYIYLHCRNCVCLDILRTVFHSRIRELPLFILYLLFKINWLALSSYATLIVYPILSILSFRYILSCFILHLCSNIFHFKLLSIYFSRLFYLKTPATAAHLSRFLCLGLI